MQLLMPKKIAAVTISGGTEKGDGGALAPTFFRGVPGGALIYVFTSTILPLHECI